MSVKNFFGILVVLTSVFCVSCVPVKTQKPNPKPKQQPKQGFLVKRSLGVSSAKELDGASVCLIKGSKEEKQVSDYFTYLCTFFHSLYYLIRYCISST